ncbi:hypothetical protein ACP4OV_020343 [Aristida adscensionis]
MDWSEDGLDEEEEQLQLAPRRRAAGALSVTPARTSDAGPPSPPLRWVSGSRPSSPPPGRSPTGSRSPSPRRIRMMASRLPSPPRAPVMATRYAASVRTTRRSPPGSPPRSAGADADAAAAGGEDDGGVEEFIAALREGLASPDAAAGGSASGAAKGGVGSFSFPPLQGPTGDADEEEGGAVDAFSFPQAQMPPEIVEEEAEAEAEGGAGAFSFPQLQTPPAADVAEVLDAFALMEEAREANSAAEFLDATMGAKTARTEAIKTELLVGRRVLDIAGLERWLRRAQAVAELAWFTEMCCDEDKRVPPLDLFEGAFRALEHASSDELHRGADARRHWIRSVPVPEFFLCPVSKKIMEHPVVILSGKTVDRSALEKWWKEHKRICPVTGEILAHTVFIPNLLIAMCISRWRAKNNIRDDLGAPPFPPAISPQEEAVFKQVTLMAHSPRYSKEAFHALFRLHELVNKQSSIVHLFGHNPGAITKLASILPETCLEPDPEMDNMVLGIIAKAASYGPNKAAFGDDQYTIPVLIARALLGPLPTRVKCAQILGILAEDYYNKIKIGELGGIAALMELLSVGDKAVKKTVAPAIASVCEAQENWSRFFGEGVTDAAISLLRDDELEDEAFSILMQAEGFDLAMMQIIEKLQRFRRNETCKQLMRQLWHTFLFAKPGRRRDEIHPARSSSASSSSNESDIEGFEDDDDLTDQTKKDVKAIVAWLQKRCYYPRSYRYND